MYTFQTSYSIHTADYHQFIWRAAERTFPAFGWTCKETNRQYVPQRRVSERFHQVSLWWHFSGKEMMILALSHV